MTNRSMMQKLEFDEINWQKKGFLYRFHLQSRLEKVLLNCFAQQKKPHYWGYTDQISGEELTFCTAHYLPSISMYIKPLDEYTLSQEVLTHYPLIMEINANNYKDKLMRSLHGEGIIIQGEIALKDIKILYSFRHDNLLEDNETNKANSERMRSILSRLITAGGFSETDLIEKIKPSTYKQTHNKIKIEAFGGRLQLNSNTEEEEKIQNYYNFIQEHLG